MCSSSTGWAQYYRISSSHKVPGPHCACSRLLLLQLYSCSRGSFQSQAPVGAADLMFHFFFDFIISVGMSLLQLVKFKQNNKFKLVTHLHCTVDAKRNKARNTACTMLLPRLFLCILDLEKDEVILCISLCYSCIHSSIFICKVLGDLHEKK
jgi:hypothetical protein